MSEVNRQTNVIEKYFINIFRYHFIDYQGRVRRKEFWLFFLFSFITSVVLTPIAFLGAIFSIIVAVPMACLAIRRLHDMGKSGFWLLLLVIPSVLSSLVFGIQLISTAAAIGSDPDGFGAFFGIWGVATLIFVLFTLACFIKVLIMLCQDSQPGENQYGSDPKGA